MELSADTGRELLRTMILIRRFELAADEQYKLGRIPGAAHLYLGEEATAAGVCALLSREDYVVSTHRGHGHCLAKGCEPRRVMAELMGKATGYSRGRGGSMHIFAKEFGLLGTNGIVGGGLPLAVGAALHAKLRKSGQVAVGFFGDGAANNGTFAESVNLAGVLQVPVVFVCENNLYATETAVREATLTKDFAARAAAYGIPGEVMDGNDVLDVYAKAARAIERARAGGGPTLLESKTYRTCGHYVGHAEGGYRSRDELEAWRERDPIRVFSRRLLDGNDMDAASISAMELEVQAVIDEAVRFAVDSAFPAEQEALTDAFV